MWWGPCGIFAVYNRVTQYTMYYYLSNITVTPGRSLGAKSGGSRATLHTGYLDPGGNPSVVVSEGRLSH